MNIDEITIGQAKELATFVSNTGDSAPPSIASQNIGKYVIVRSLNEGINAGVVVMADATGVILEEARRLHYMRPLDQSLSWYEGVAESGLCSSSKVSSPAHKIIMEPYSMTRCTTASESSIRSFITNAQS